jgi:hypothetical protein
MAEYKVDRALLESYPSDEILRILREEQDDYTPEALKVFEEILESRNASSHTLEDQQRQALSATPKKYRPAREGMSVNDPADAVRVLNTLLSGVIDGTIDPQVSQVAANIVMGILRAKEQEFMISPGEES